MRDISKKMKYIFDTFKMPEIGKILKRKVKKSLKINQKDSATLKKEVLKLGNFRPDPEVFNPRLLNWLEEFVFRRPYEALGYKIPIEFIS